MVKYRQEEFMNTVSLVGRLVRDPDAKRVDNDLALSKFSIAVDRYFGAQKQERQSLGKVTADFPRIVVWGRQAENCAKYLRKGSLVSVQGRIVTSMYEKDGENVYSTEVLGDKIRFLGPKVVVDEDEFDFDTAFGMTDKEIELASGEQEADQELELQVEAPKKRVKAKSKKD